MCFRHACFIFRYGTRPKLLLLFFVSKREKRVVVGRSIAKQKQNKKTQVFQESESGLGEHSRNRRSLLCRRETRLALSLSLFRAFPSLAPSLSIDIDRRATCLTRPSQRPLRSLRWSGSAAGALDRNAMVIESMATPLLAAPPSSSPLPTPPFLPRRQRRRRLPLAAVPPRTPPPPPLAPRSTPSSPRRSLRLLLPLATSLP